MRAIWKRNYLGSGSRFYQESVETESEHSDSAVQNIDFDITPNVMVTRSKGAPMRIDNVQPRTLEYKRYKK